MANTWTCSMSGGSYDYFYHKLEQFAYDMSISPSEVERKAFQELLFKVAKACHDIEWVDSGDYSAGDELESIKACFSGNTEDKYKATAYDSMVETMKRLEDVRSKV